MQNDLPRAEARLAALEAACGQCEELKDLRGSVAAFKAKAGKP
jgi:hypothetical protein